MEHCLNKRIRNYEISKTDEQEILTPEFHKKRQVKKRQLPSYADAWRDQNVSQKLMETWYSPFTGITYYRDKDGKFYDPTPQKNKLRPGSGRVQDDKTWNRGKF